MGSRGKHVIFVDRQKGPPRGSKGKDAGFVGRRYPVCILCWLVVKVNLWLIMVNNWNNNISGW